MQDVLGFGSDCRMNTPGTVKNNWVWRCAGNYFSDEVADYLLKEITFYNRVLPQIKKSEVQTMKAL
jgi:4-alpha-glucanotransferase